MHMYIQKGYYSIVFVVLCMKNIVYQQIVTMHKDSIPVPSTVCVSAPYSELHKPEYPYCLSCGATD